MLNKRKKFLQFREKGQFFLKNTSMLQNVDIWFSNTIFVSKLLQPTCWNIKQLSAIDIATRSLFWAQIVIWSIGQHKKLWISTGLGVSSAIDPIFQIDPSSPWAKYTILKACDSDRFWKNVSFFNAIFWPLWFTTVILLRFSKYNLVNRNLAILFFNWE